MPAAARMSEAEVAEILAAIRATAGGCAWQCAQAMTVASVRRGVPGGYAGTLSKGQFTALMLAAERAVNTHEQWADAEGMTLAGLCAANQDALIDDLWEDHPGDRPHRFDMADLIRTYDTMLGTRRADTDLPPPPEGHLTP